MSVYVWEQRKLGKVVSHLYGGLSLSPKDYAVKGILTIPKSAINKSGMADLTESKYVSNKTKNRQAFQVTNGDLITCLRDLVPTAPNLGRIVQIISNQEEYVLPQGVYKIEPTKNIIPSFLIDISNSDKFRKKVFQQKNGSTQVHMRNKQYLNINIPYTDLTEQKKISMILSCLEEIISLQQRKLNTIIQLKKGLLNKIFFQHKNSSEWKKGILQDFIYEISSKKFITKHTEKSGKYDIIQQGEKPLYGKSNKNPFKNYKKVVLFGDHTLSLYKPTVPFLLSTDGVKIISSRVFNRDFLFVIIKEFMPRSQGYRRHFSVLKKQTIYYPENKQFQIEIGLLDSILVKEQKLVEERISKLTLFKKFLLQNMFI